MREKHEIILEGHLGGQPLLDLGLQELERVRYGPLAPLRLTTKWKFHFMLKIGDFLQSG